MTAMAFDVIPCCWTLSFIVLQKSLWLVYVCFCVCTCVCVYVCMCVYACKNLWYCVPLPTWIPAGSFNLYVTAKYA